MIKLFSDWLVESKEVESNSFIDTFKKTLASKG